MLRRIGGWGCSDRLVSKIGCLTVCLYGIFLGLYAFIDTPVTNTGNCGNHCPLLHKNNYWLKGDIVNKLDPKEVNYIPRHIS